MRPKKLTDRVYWAIKGKRLARQERAKRQRELLNNLNNPINGALLKLPLKVRNEIYAEALRFNAKNVINLITKTMYSLTDLLRDLITLSTLNGQVQKEAEDVFYRRTKFWVPVDAKGNVGPWQ